jgi:hypothetical protein
MVPQQNPTAQTELAAPDQLEPNIPVHLVLEVIRGNTRFPRRPVQKARYLIGAGESCDLRLGGDDMPALHSIIKSSGPEVTLEAIAAEPNLSVNGSQIQTTQLRDGDVITVGQVELLARMVPGQAPAGAVSSLERDELVTDDERPLEELSAAELVDLIEQDELAIEEFEGRQQVGLKGLVQAIMSRADRPAHKGLAGLESRLPIAPPHFLTKRPAGVMARARHLEQGNDRLVQADLDKLGEHLTNLSQELKGTSERATRREAELASVTDDLLDTQNKLVTQLEAVIDQVQTLKSNEAPKVQPRAIA